MKSQISTLTSRLFEGHVTHTRSKPIFHQFKYRVFWYYLNLDEIENICKYFWFWSFNQFNLISYFPKDHSTLNFQPKQPISSTQTAHLSPAKIPTHISDIKSHIKQQIKAEFNQEFKGEIFVLTNLRYLGYVFNPVTFYFCFDDHKNLRYIIAQITNTPWGEKHPYLFNIESISNNLKDSSKENKIWHEFSFSKSFHISPFNPMNMKYFWRFNLSENQINIQMNASETQLLDNQIDHQTKNIQQQDKHFNVVMSLKAQVLTRKSSFKFLFKYPFYTFKVVSGIFWQAFLLWLKKAPFYNHPRS